MNVDIVVSERDCIVKIREIFEIVYCENIDALELAAFSYADFGGNRYKRAFFKRFRVLFEEKLHFIYLTACDKLGAASDEGICRINLYNSRCVEMDDTLADSVE